MSKSIDFSHSPVLLNETVGSLALKPGYIVCDGTLGGGGHAKEVCEAIGKDGFFIGIDRDREAIAAAKENLIAFPCKKVFENRNFDEVAEVLKAHSVSKIDAAVLDLGVSSRQLDEAARGFSYKQDGPLDMRMDSADSLTAKEVVNTYEEKELARIFRVYGEERFAKRIAGFIARARQKKTLETTGELAEIVKSAIPAATRREGPHPAKRVFQAIRIEVNDELSSLERALGTWIDSLKQGGRLAIITFHSLEDRIVKTAFQSRENPCTCPKDAPICVCGKKPDAKRVNRKPILPSEEEIAENPRARSAKLRVLEKL